MSEIQNRIEGARDEAKGKIEQAAGDVTGDTKLKIEGKATEIKGGARQELGKAEGLAEKLKAKVSHLLGTDKPKAP